MLKIRLKSNKHNAVWLVEPKVSIGRAGENDFVVDDATVAANHVEIQVSHENLTLVNVSGGSQVTINGKVVEQKSPLAAEDVVGIGNVQLEVVDPKQEQRPAPAAQGDKQSAAGWALKSNHTALSNRVFPVKKETVIGRSNDCDITLAAAHLSRRHVKLSIQEGLLYVKDLGSANGTYLNGKRVVGEERVRRGDELRFDTLSFGVIGPAQDMDKTTVRPIPTIQPPSKQAGQKPAIKSNSKPATQNTPKPVAARSASVAAKSAAVGVDDSGSKGTIVAIVAIVVVVAAGLGVAFQQGLLG